MTVCSISAFRDEDTTLTILWDEDAKRQYLMLPELGKVLQKLRRALPGTCVSTLHKFRRYIRYMLLYLSPQLLFPAHVTSHLIFWNLVLQTYL